MAAPMVADRHPGFWMGLVTDKLRFVAKVAFLNMAKMSKCMSRISRISQDLQETDSMRFAAQGVMIAILMTGCAAIAQTGSPNDKSWIAQSNQYTNLLIDINNKHQPEGASRQGLAQYDALIGQPLVAGARVLAEVIDFPKTKTMTQKYPQPSVQSCKVDQSPSQKA